MPTSGVLCLSLPCLALSLLFFSIAWSNDAEGMGRGDEEFNSLASANTSVQPLMISVHSETVAGLWSFAITSASWPMVSVQALRIPADILTNLPSAPSASLPRRCSPRALNRLMMLEESL